MDGNFTQPFFDPAIGNMPPNFVPQNAIFPPPQMPITPTKTSTSFLSRVPSLHLPALILFAFCWLIHTIAIFIPYWSVYSGISGSRAGLWSARNFNYLTIQNFYFPEINSFPTLTSSIRFTTANTKGYLVTVQFLMTFNFVMMTFLLGLLIMDYVSSRRSNGVRSVLMREHNTSDTALIYGLLLYFLYVFTVFEFAGWITYVASRKDNNWQMHASFGLVIVVSVFLIIVFVMYVMEFLKTFKKNRVKWEYWYGPYIEWGFFVHLTGLLFLLLVICCPEWAYDNFNIYYIFGEIGLFKQCFLSGLYKKSLSSGLCTLSNPSSNQSWVNATQAFMLMAFIFGMILLILMIVFRNEFRHNQQGYDSDRFSQPTFTYVIAGLILFFCFIFSLIGVAVFGAKVFPSSITVNWAYIIAVIAMELFLVAGILFILDGIHSRKQTTAAKAAGAEKLLFPEPLNNRLSGMQPLIKPELPLQPTQPRPWPMIPPALQPMTPYDFPQQQFPMYPGSYFDNPSFVPSPENYPMEQYPGAPIAQATLSNYFQQMMNNPQVSILPYNQGLENYAAGNLLDYPPNRNPAFNNNNLNELARLNLVQQQQRLDYNHERLLEKYNRLRAPRATEFRPFGTSSLPGRNYNQYLQQMRGDDDNGLENSLVAQSRAGIGSSNETYRWMGNDYSEPLPRYVSSFMQHSRNDPIPNVRAEKFEPVHIYNHPVFGPTPAYLRPVFKKTKDIKKQKHRESKSSHSRHPEEKSRLTSKDDVHDKEFIDHVSSGYVQNKNLIPVDPLLLNIYNQRSNGDIQGYGRSLYAPSNQRTHDRRPSHYEEMIAASLSDTESILANKPHEPSSSSSSSATHRYNELHSQPTETTVTSQLSNMLTTDLISPSSNTFDPLMPSKPESISTVPYQTISNTYNDSSTNIPKSSATQRLSNSQENSELLKEKQFNRDNAKNGAE